MTTTKKTSAYTSAFRNVDPIEGEPTPDGKIILHYEPKNNKVAAI